MSTVKRAYFALTKIRAESRSETFILRIATTASLVRKIRNKHFPKWSHRSITATVQFHDVEFSYFVPKGYDFDIYLNPYFHEYEITSFVVTHLREGDAFVDIGAHAGAYTLLSSKKVQAKGKVISFEPNPLNLTYLSKNIKLNHIENATIIPLAASKEKGTCQLHYSESDTALSSTVFNKYNREKTIEVEKTTVDEVCQSLGIEQVKIIKIDTEGCDFQVLQGALNTLKGTQYVIIEHSEKCIKELLLSLNYALTYLEPSGYLLATKKGLFS